jgi:hypothetical protein
MSASLIRGLGAVLLAGLALGAAAPASAQPYPFFSDTYRPTFQLCLLTETQLRSQIAAHGYSRVKMTPDNRGWREVEAVRDGWKYLLTVRSCTGQIVEARRLGRA